MDDKFLKRVVFINSLVPLSLLLFDWYRDNLGANPIEYFLRATGLLTIVFIMASLAVTPVREIFGFNKLIKYRRMLGLFAFFYGLVHLATYSIFDKSGSVSAIFEDVWQRPFIAVGMFGFATMIPLAITSTNGMIKRIGGKRWQLIHRLAYLAGLAGVVHYFWIQKSDYRYPIVAGLILAFLLGYRMYKKWTVDSGQWTVNRGR